ncbi:MAG: DUF262 domain-containing protein [Chloroflexi bacterium]|nr:DUF262 domain-containing protein [Chloroflexota bacterium]
MAKLTTDYGTVRKLISGDSQYRVPKYQRRYRWRSTHELLDLWEDILARYVALEDSEGTAGADDTHFLGALVIGQSDAPEPLGVTPYVVIDGQQRVMSLMLALAAVRDSLLDDEREKQEITAKLLVHSSTDQLRLESSEDDREDFEAIMFRGEPTSNRSMVNAAYHFFLEQVRSGVNLALLHRDDSASVAQAEEEGEEGEEGEEVEELGDPSEDGTSIPIKWDRMLIAVLDRLELVIISDVTPENAYQVFRTLNSTGMPLSQADLLRNAFFMLLPTRAEYAYDNLWVPLERALGTRLQDYFHTELLRLGHNIPRQHIYRTAMSSVKRGGLAEEDIVETLTQWRDHGQIYAALLSAPSEPGVSIRGNVLSASHLSPLRNLLEWGSIPAHPLILDAAIRWASHEITDSDFQFILERVESLLIRRYIAEVPPNDLRSSFAQLMGALSESLGDGDYLTAVTDHLLSARMRWPDDDQIRRRCTEGGFYRGTRQRDSFFILKRIAYSMEGKERPDIRRGTGADEYSIEHVLPQTLTEDWNHDLEQWGDDPVKTWLERKDAIGNLTLTAYNSELGQLRFQDKKAIIAEKARLQLSKMIISSDEWTRSAIDERSEELAEAIIDLWRRPPSPQP